MALLQPPFSRSLRKTVRDLGSEYSSSVGSHWIGEKVGWSLRLGSLGLLDAGILLDSALLASSFSSSSNVMSGADDRRVSMNDHSRAVTRIGAAADDTGGVGGGRAAEVDERPVR